MNRFDNTTEKQAVLFEVPLEDISVEDKAVAYRVLTHTPADQSKWFLASVVQEYQYYIRPQLNLLKDLIARDPHSRRLTMGGPPDGCWLNSQILSLQDGGYHMIATYRSLDLDHVGIDSAFQFLLGEQLTAGQIRKLSIFAGSLHRYL
jgi:hypothetical protein